MHMRHCVDACVYVCVRMCAYVFMHMHVRDNGMGRLQVHCAVCLHVYCVVPVAGLQVPCVVPVGKSHIEQLKPFGNSKNRR